MNQGRVSTCAKRLAVALNNNRMKQSELCQLTKIPKSAISQYISGAFEPKQDRIYLMAKALNVSEAWLMGFDVPMERQEKSLPEEPKLSEEEKMLLDLFRLVPEDQQQLVLGMIRAALNSRG